VDIGSNRELEDESESVPTGLVVGGIVDVRGNANIDGTILSMYRPASGWTSPIYATFASNIGFSDENPFESSGSGDAGTIHIHPDPSRMLPLGMKSNITIDPNQGSYTEH
jgi:hypothetical protein